VTCGYVTLHGKGEFADGIKDLEVGRRAGGYISFKEGISKFLRHRVKFSEKGEGRGLPTWH